MIPPKKSGTLVSDVVPCEHVESNLMHVQNLKWSKSIRDRTSQEEARARKQKYVDYYDWASLLEQGKLRTL